MKENEEALLCGIMLGDGCLSAYKLRSGSKEYEIVVTLNLKEDFEFALMTKSLIEKISKNKVRIKKRESINAVLVQTYSKEALEYMNKKWGFMIGLKGEISIPRQFFSKKSTMKHVVSGLFATDGTVIFSRQHKKEPYYPRIEFATKSNKLLGQVADFLRAEKYMISAWKNKNGINRISIHGFESTIRFDKEIGLINLKHKNKFSMGLKHPRTNRIFNGLLA